MSTPTYTLEVHLRPTNATASPGALAARDAAALIAAVEAMIAGQLDADLSIRRAELSDHDWTLVFTSDHAAVDRAFALAAEGITAESWAGLSTRAIDAVREIRRIARKYAIETEFHAPASDRRVVVRPSLHVETGANAGLRSDSTIYGTVIRVGGEEPPRARLRLLDGRVLTCEITRRKSWRIARELGARLYQRTGVRGEARYAPTDATLVAFRIDEVLSYNDLGVGAALNRLAAAGGIAFRAENHGSDPSARLDDEG